jgi:hypothetical protein
VTAIFQKKLTDFGVQDNAKIFERDFWSFSCIRVDDGMTSGWKDSNFWDSHRNDTGLRRQLERAEWSWWLFATSLFAVVVRIGDAAKNGPV